MKPPISDIAFTDSVKAIQARMGSRKQYERMETTDGWKIPSPWTSRPSSANVIPFISPRPIQKGQPYIEHRGGPNGISQGVG